MSRLKAHGSFARFLGVCALFFTAVPAGFAVMVWQQLALPERELVGALFHSYGSYFISIGLVLLTALAFAVDFLYRLYILPLNRIAEETAIIYGANSGHRIQPRGGEDAVRLARAVNLAADRFDELRRSVDERMEAARARAEAERNILSAVLAELPQGVLVCTAEGRITLYNERASHFLAGSGPSADAGRDDPEVGFVGLGRSVFGVVPAGLVRHGLEEIEAKLRGGRETPSAAFMTVGGGARILQATLVPILSPHRELSGFVLVLADVSGQSAAERQFDGLLQTVATRLRGALGGIRAAAEVIRDHPGLDAAKLAEFNRIIHAETLAAGEGLARLTAEHQRIAGHRGPLVPARMRDLLAALRRKAEEALGVQLEGEPPDEGLWVRIDSYTLVLGLTFLLGRLRETVGLTSLRCRARARPGFAELDFLWRGPPLRLETIRQWEGLPAAASSPASPTFKEIAERHGIELWSQAASAAPEAYLRLLIPAVAPLQSPPANRRTLLPSARPVYFDFDLFNQPGQVPELDDRSLAELAYTVFDTETTGLDPRGGDEIIAIGAVRIVNGRLLAEEVFDRLVNPRRSVPWESVKVHGIQPEVLAGQPGIEAVLRQFHKFAEGTVLVAHNAAFDMRLLQLKEEATGVRFVNPVLDTMLLSAALHPSQEEHGLEAIASRLGIAVIGRHTALGDAMVTAEVFLKLVPLLSERGMATLKQAREGSRKTYYARRTY
jgi:DNA polymerase-3 subunit epsilon